MVLYLDVVCLTYDGNLWDAAILACMAAMKTSRIPSLEYDEETDIVQKIDGVERSLILQGILLPSTFGFFGEDSVLADPTSREESVLEGTMTIVYNDQGNIGGIFKQGGRPLKQEQIDRLMEEASKHSDRIRNLFHTLCE